jgi:acyl-CoA thioesterase YciA
MIKRVSGTGGLQPAIRVVMMPRDANYLGTIFGGVILSSLDMAGAVEAQRHSDRKLVTVAMDEVKFIAPVFVGDLVSFYTETVKIGTTSITVRVTVEATRALAPHKTVRVTQAKVVYVAIDGAGKPVPVIKRSGRSRRRSGRMPGVDAAARIRPGPARAP